MNNKRYKINAPTVVSEIIDGEAVIVNMENGSYYSLDDSGAFIWGLISQGANLTELIEIVDKSYAGSDVDIESTMSTILDEFMKEELLIEAENQESIDQSLLQVSSFDQKFNIPELKKYNDMEELLLLDPIHGE